MVKRRLAVITVLIMLCFMVPISASADGERNDIVMEAQVGFDGYFRLEQWTPITVEIENSGEDIQGSLEVVANQNSSTGVLYTRPAVIPRNSKKRFVLYVQVNSIQKEMNINLVEGGKIVKTHQVKGLMPLTWRSYLLGVVTEDKAGMSYWWNTLGNDRIFANHETVHMEVQNIPDRKEILDNFSILVFNNADTSLLTKEQKVALTLWIEDGGILIVGTGANGNKTLGGLSPEILPLKAGEISIINEADELSRIAGSTLSKNDLLQIMDLKSDAGEMIVQDRGQDLVWKYELGNGYVFVSAFDLGLEPVIDWAGNKVFWAKLLPMHLNSGTVNKLENPEMQREFDSMYGMDLYNQISGALSNIEAMDIPSYTGLLILLAAYLAVVGPINYIILKKMDKREWSWVTIPLLVLLFSTGIYAMGYTRKGNEVIVNSISAVRLQPNNSSAQIDTYIGVFIPKKGDYTISADKDVLMAMFNQGGSDYYGSDQDGTGQSKIIQARVNQGNPASLEIYDANVWTMKALAMTDAKTDFGTLQSNLYYHDGKIEGQVTNNTPYPLSDLVIYTPYGYQKLGNVASGESRQVDFNVSVSTYGNSAGQAIYQMVNDMYPYAYIGGSTTGESEEQRKQRIRRSVVEGLLARPVETKLGIADNGSFVKAFAFCDANLGEKIQVNGKEPGKVYYQGLVMANLEVLFEKDGIVSIPPGQINATLNKELSRQANIELGSIYLDQGQAVFDFSMNLYKDIDFSKVEIHSGILHGTPRLSIYDVEDGEFIYKGDGIDINYVQGTISIEPEVLPKYVDDQRKLQIKVEGEGNNSVSLKLPTMAIEGRRR